MRAFPPDISVEARERIWRVCGRSGIWAYGNSNRAVATDRLLTVGKVITGRHPDTVRGSDVAFFSYTRIPKDSPPEGYSEVSPELVFEVRSPSDRWSEINKKASEYLAAGVLVVCVLDPETRTAVVYTENDSPSKKTGDDELTLPKVFPDFKVPVRQFFE